MRLGAIVLAGCLVSCRAEAGGLPATVPMDELTATKLDKAQAQADLWNERFAQARAQVQAEMAKVQAEVNQTMDHFCKAHNIDIKDYDIDSVNHQLTLKTTTTTVPSTTTTLVEPLPR